MCRPVDFLVLAHWMTDRTIFIINGLALKKNTNLINLETPPTPPFQIIYYLLDSHRELPGDHKIVADDTFCSSEDFEKVRL